MIGPTSRCGYDVFTGSDDIFITALGRRDQPSTTAYSSGVPWVWLPRWSLAGYYRWRNS